MNHLESKVTLFKDVTETQTPHFVSLDKALERIKTGRTKQIIDQVREYARKGNKEAASRNKAKLPCVLFSGKFDTEVEIVNQSTGEVTYSKRTDDSLTEHSGVVILDYDDIEPHELKPKLSQDPYILSCWTSPSGNGVKALVKIQNGDRHRDHYRSILAHFSKYGELDTSNINPSRVCYESYDPAIYINSQSWVWSGLLEEKKPKNNLGGLTVGVYDYDYSKIQPIIKYIRNAMEGERHTKLNKSAYTLGGYIATGYLPKDLSRHILLEEYKKINPEEPLKEAERAVDSGIQAGVLQPIWEFENHEKEFLQEVGDSQMDFLSDKGKAIFDLSKWWSGDKPETWTSGWAELDPYFVHKVPSFNILLAHENIGKTFIVSYLMVAAAINHGWSGAILAIENQTKWMIRDMMGFAAGKNVKDMDVKEFKFYSEFVMDYFDFIEPDNYSYQEALDMFDNIKSKKSIKQALLDPYNSLIRKGLNAGNPYAYDTEAGARLLNYTRTRELILWLNVHTVSEARRRYHTDGEYAGLVKKPTKGDVEMGQVWQNKADMFMIAHRYVKHQEARERFTTSLSVEKVKDKYTGGDIHPYGEEFRMRLHDMSYFKCELTGQRAFKPIKPNIQEF